MKINAIFVLVIVSGAGFAGTFGYFLNSGNSPKTEAPMPAPEPAPLPAAPKTTMTPANVPRVFTNTVRVDWRQVESDDYRKYIANLRAIGCPEDTIRDIIVADVNKLFEAREKALGGGAPSAKFEFWKRQAPRAVTEEKVKERIQLAKEKRTLLKELLGVDVEDKTPLLPSSDSENRLAFLSKDKRDQVRELEATYRAKVQGLMGNRMRPTKQDLEAYTKLMAEGESAVGKVLTPEEFETFQLTTSQTAQMMRVTMGDFEMSEQEFRDAFKVRKEFEDKYGMTMGGSVEEPAKTLARAEMENKLRNLMGDDRYTLYYREQSWSMSSLQTVAQEYGIPKETATKVFDYKPLAEEQAAKIRLDSSLDAAQRMESLQAVQQLTLKSITEVLGKDPAEAYYRQGAWIKNLALEK